MAEQHTVAENGVDNEKLTKKDLKRAKKAERKSNKKGGGFIKLVLIMVIILGGVFSLIYFNVFNIRSNYINDIIVDTPFEQIFVNAPSTDKEHTVSRDELLSELNALTNEVASLQAENQDLIEKNDLYVKQISSLEPLAEEQIKFKEDKALFDSMVAEGDSNAFKAFYENMYPDNARQSYENLIIAENENKAVTEYVATFTSMEEDSAASILEVMSQTDLNLVVNILNSMKSDKSGNILAEMTPESAANIARRMAPVGY